MEDGFRCPPDAVLHSGHGATTTEPLSHSVALADSAQIITVVDALDDAQPWAARRVHHVHGGPLSTVPLCPRLLQKEENQKQPIAEELHAFGASLSVYGLARLGTSLQ